MIQHIPASRALIKYFGELPSTADQLQISKTVLLEDLFSLFWTVGSKNQADIAILQAFDVILSSEAAEEFVTEDNAGVAKLLISNCQRISKIVPRIKNVQRVVAMMKLSVPIRY